MGEQIHTGVGGQLGPGLPGGPGPASTRPLGLGGNISVIVWIPGTQFYSLNSNTNNKNCLL